LLTNIEPSSVSEALKNTNWVVAMKQEYEELIKIPLGIWFLFPLKEKLLVASGYFGLKKTLMVVLTNTNPS